MTLLANSRARSRCPSRSWGSKVFRGVSPALEAAGRVDSEAARRRFYLGGRPGLSVPRTRPYDADGNLINDGVWTSTWAGGNRLTQMQPTSLVLSVTKPLDKRNPQPKRLIEFIRWAADLKTMHRCCTSETRDCSTCKDGAAHMSWVMVNKRAHLRSAKDLQNWIEVYEMFAKLYKFVPW